MTIMTRNPDRPRVTFQRHDLEHPFLLSVDEGRVLVPMRRSDERALRWDLEAAEQLDTEVRQCDGNRHHPGDVVETLDDGSLVHLCRHCPAEVVLPGDGTVLPVEEA